MLGLAKRTKAMILVASTSEVLVDILGLAKRTKARILIASISEVGQHALPADQGQDYQRFNQ